MVAGGIGAVDHYVESRVEALNSGGSGLLANALPGPFFFDGDRMPGTRPLSDWADEVTQQIKERVVDYQASGTWENRYGEAVPFDQAFDEIPFPNDES